VIASPEQLCVNHLRSASQESRSTEVFDD